MKPIHIYEVRRRKDHRGFDLISDALPFGGLSYTKPDDAVGYAKFYSRSHPTIISRIRRIWQRDRNARTQGRF